jgi:hypothetical protein
MAHRRRPGAVNGIGPVALEDSTAALSQGGRHTIQQPPSDFSRHTMKNALIAIAFLFGAVAAHAQATTAVKEAGKATSETAKQATENTKAAMSSEPSKTAHKTKAKTHKAKAKTAGTESKDAAKAAVK